MRQFRLPTLLGLLVLVLGTAAGVVLVQNRQIFRTTAAPGEVPQKIRTTDTTDTSFTVSWITDEPTTGFVAYGTSTSLGQASQGTESSTIHYIQVKNLKPNTSYFFKIGSGKNTFDNQGSPYQVKTGPTLATPPPTDIIFGSVTAASGRVVPRAIVLATLPGATTVSGLTTAEGKFSISLSTARTTNLSSYAAYNPQSEKFEILVQADADQKDQTATAKVLTGGARPVPPITLGKNHDFTNLPPLQGGNLPKSQVNLPEDQAQPAQSGFSVEEISGGPSQKINIQLQSPGDKEEINTKKPQFVGTGTPGTKFTIIVESQDTYSGEVTVGKNGSWSWSPPDNLEPGEHTVTLSWKDTGGQTRIARRKFTVLLAGESGIPAFTASPSGSTKTPRPTPTVKPTSAPLASPSASPQGRVSMPSTESGVPVSGNLTPSLGILIMGIILLVVGIFIPRTKFF